MTTDNYNITPIGRLVVGTGLARQIDALERTLRHLPQDDVILYADVAKSLAIATALMALINITEVGNE